MKVYTCTAFTGHYPVGTAAVIIAVSRIEAHKMLVKELEKYGLAQDVKEADIEQVSLGRASVYILRDGNY